MKNSEVTLVKQQTMGNTLHQRTNKQLPPQHSVIGLVA